MLQSIGTSPSSVAATSKPAGTGILETQLNRYQTQLADWCNCPSGKTADGKKKIADIQGKADAVKAQLQKIELARTRQAADATKTDELKPRRVPGVSTVGNLIDVTA